MLILEICQVALQAIRANKLRSFLTMLGIIIGVGAVITMIALGSGAQKAIQDSIAALGTNLLSVTPGQSWMRGVASESRVSLTTDDADELRRSARYLVAVLPEISRNMQVKKGNRNANISVTGTTSEYFEHRNWKLVAGRGFTPGDDEARRRYAILGASVPEIFGQNATAMVGQEFQIRGIPFEIIGVLESKGAQTSFQNPDEQIFIPFNTARYRTHGTDRVRNIYLKVGDAANINVAIIEAERILRRTHKIRPGSDNNFSIRNQAELQNTFAETTETFSLLLAWIAVVSLIVGGIGIMNIMLVSVTERTREIGVRKAIGATKANILLQFLVEALVLCLVGGALGIVVGIGAAHALSSWAQWNTLISPFAIVLAFAFSFMVGIFFGIWPARRAAGLDPIVALRYE
jgi:putative ABC transport system permease protein